MGSLPGYDVYEHI